jgi:ABC-2 type transport system ATP-binding protein
VHDPQVLILDEPASGLDPRARIEIRELLVELARMGKTIFFSTHILADVSEICTHIGIIEAGQLVVQGRMEDVRRRWMASREVVITLLGRAEDAKRELVQMPSVVEVTELADDGGRQRLRVAFNGEDQVLTDMLQALSVQNIPVLNFNEEAHDLESVFMRVTKGIVS